MIHLLTNANEYRSNTTTNKSFTTTVVGWKGVCPRARTTRVSFQTKLMQQDTEFVTLHKKREAQCMTQVSEYLQDLCLCTVGWWWR